MSVKSQDEDGYRVKTMTVKTYIRSILLGALVALSLAGFIIHSRIHILTQNPSFIVPFVAGIPSIAVIPALSWFKKTLAYRPETCPQNPA